MAIAIQITTFVLLIAFGLFAFARIAKRHRLEKIATEDFDVLQKIYLSGIQSSTLEQCLQLVLEMVSDHLGFEFSHILKVKDGTHASSFHIWHHCSRRLSRTLRSLMEEEASAFNCLTHEPYVLSVLQNHFVVSTQRQHFINDSNCQSIVYVPLIIKNEMRYCLECFSELPPAALQQPRVRNFLKRLQTLLGPLVESILNKQELITAKQLALEASRAKSEFLAMMSHEIRTPLQGLLGMTKIIRDSNNSFESNKFASMAYNSAQSLFNVITSVLDYSKIEAGRLEIVKGPFDIIDVISSAIANFSAMTRNKNIALNSHYQEDVIRHLTGDKQRIWEVIVNLISNAIKFTESGSIDVYAETTPSPSDPSQVVLEIRVKDTGIGIPFRQQGQIFKNFVQGDHGLVRRHEGSGLGLAICKNLVDLMHGEIDFISHEGHGSTFWVRLNLKRQQTPPQQVPQTPFFPQPHIPEKPPRVLLVEDNEVSRCYFEFLLEQMNISFVSCEDGQTAIEELNRDLFDLVLLDCHLPRISGFDVARYIRSHLDNLHQTKLPIIAITGYAFKDDTAICNLIGVTDYIYKPILEEEFIKKLSQWLPIAEQQQKPARQSHANPNVLPHKSLSNIISDEFDFSVLRKACEKHQPEERDQIVRQVVEAFFKNTPTRVQELNDAIAVGNAEVIWRRSHSIRTSAEIFGAKKLSLVCRIIEEKGRQATLPSASEANDLTTEFRKLESVLKHLIYSPNASLN